MNTSGLLRNNKKNESTVKGNVFGSVKIGHHQQREDRPMVKKVRSHSAIGPRDVSEAKARMGAYTDDKRGRLDTSGTRVAEVFNYLPSSGKVA